MNLPRLVFRLLLGRRLPIVDGSLEIPGLVRPITIRRDSYGIPHIEAEDDRDAWYALGFCQGQDRAFKLESLLRVARGTLAERIGPRGLPIDRLSRRIGFARSAEQQLPVLAPHIRRMLEAFARGVTDGSSLGCNRVAHEFAIVRARPTRFTAADPVAIAKLLSFSMASNWDIELARLHILREDGPEAMSALDPAYPEWLPVSYPHGAPAGANMDRLAEDLRLLGETVGTGGGSNNWALAPSRTSTGRAILAGDAHLPPHLPPIWYLAHIRTPDWSVAGASFVGTPAFPIGHNAIAAWAPTAGLADNTDLFIEEIGPDGSSVREGDRFVPCEVRNETIRVRWRPDVVEEVVVTPRGPIIGPALHPDMGSISMRATWLDPRPARGLMDVHKARSFEEFRRTFQEWPLMSLNMLYADTSGTIGWQLVGEVPRRQTGWGTIPQMGSDPQAGWRDGVVPFEEMPHAVDPPGGVLATANNRPLAEDEGPYLGIDWIDGYRLARISEALGAHRTWDVPGTLALQMDQHSIPWREMRDEVMSVPCRNGDALEGMDLLTKWDGVVSADSPPAAVFELFIAEMVRRIAEAKAPKASRSALGKGFTPLLPTTLLTERRIGQLVRLIREQPDGWFPSPWTDVIEEALASAVGTLRVRYGGDHRSWAWGEIRPLTLQHPVGRAPLLGRVFNLGPFSWGGDAATIGHAKPDPSEPTGNPLVIASIRMVVDVGNWAESRFSMPGGQSGNPLSPHYDDLLRLWKRGDGAPIAWSADEVHRATRATLRLMPEPQSG